jgi:hypothetical protein
MSASGVAAVSTPAVVLVTSAAEAAGDSTTGVCGTLVTNASCPEAFLSLSDDVGGTLLTERRPKQTANALKNEVMS